MPGAGFQPNGRGAKREPEGAATVANSLNVGTEGPPPETQEWLDITTCRGRAFYLACREDSVMSAPRASSAQPSGRDARLTRWQDLALVVSREAPRAGAIAAVVLSFVHLGAATAVLGSTIAVSAGLRLAVLGVRKKGDGGST